LAGCLITPMRMLSTATTAYVSEQDSTLQASEKRSGQSAISIRSRRQQIGYDA
jgi:hypothetical protein